jgi:hypothetical protein
LADTSVSRDRVLFGDRTTSALLSLAAQEGLLEQGIGDADFMFDQCRSRDIPVWLAREISQQIILCPHVYGMQEDREIFAGELLGEGVLTFSPPKGESDADTGVSAEASRALAIVTTEAALGLLAAQGINMTTDELITKWAFVEKENSDLAKSLTHAGIAVENVLENRFSIFMALTFGKQTSEIMRLQKRRSELEDVALPIMSAFGELSNTFGHAQKEDIQSIFLPRHSSAHGEVQDSLTSPPGAEFTGATEAALLRVVTERLGRLPYRPSLRESITLARSSPAKDLRELLHQWTDELPNGVTQQLTAIEREAAKAVRALTQSQDLAFGSKFITYIGGAGLLLSAIAHIPPEFGIGTTIMGVGIQVVADRIQKKYNWASFGNN